MQNVAASETVLFDSAVFEPVVFQPSMAPAVQAVKPRTAALGKVLLRTLLLKWDMIAVVALMLACTVYGVYAVCFLTGF